MEILDKHGIDVTHGLKKAKSAVEAIGAMVNDDADSLDLEHIEAVRPIRHQLSQESPGGLKIGSPNIPAIGAQVTNGYDGTSHISIVGDPSCS